MAAVFIGIRIDLADLLLALFKKKGIIGKDVKELTFETYLKETENARYVEYIKDGTKLEDVYETIEEWEHDYGILYDLMYERHKEYKHQDMRVLERDKIEYNYEQKLFGTRISEKLYNKPIINIMDEKDMNKMKIEIGKKLAFYGIDPTNIGIFVFVEKRRWTFSLDL